MGGTGGTTSGSCGGAGSANVGGTGRAGAGTTGEMTVGDCGGVIGAAGAAGAAGVAQIVSRFQVQIHPWKPVSIACVVSDPVVSPQVHVQFQVHVDGTLDGLVVADGCGVAVAGWTAGASGACAAGSGAGSG